MSACCITFDMVDLQVWDSLVVKNHPDERLRSNQGPRQVGPGVVGGTGTAPVSLFQQDLQSENI